MRDLHDGRERRGTLSAVNGTNKLIANMDYWVKETVAPQGYRIDETVHKIRLNGNMTIEVSDVPKYSTVHFMVVSDGVVGVRRK